MRGTHKLLVGTEERGTCQDMERKELTERRIKEKGKEGRWCFGRQGRGGEYEKTKWKIFSQPQVRWQ